LWFVLPLTIAFLIFFISALAETNRLPFDLPEAEGELIAGYHTEYSAMKFSMFYIAEYGNMVTASALMATLFFGGWDIPFMTWDNAAPHTGLKTLLTTLFFFGKILFFVFFYMWIRWTLPRFRYDQLMALGWKVLLPTALTYIVIMGGALVGLQLAGFAPTSWQFSGALLGLNVVLVVVLLFLLDRGRIVSPAYSRLVTLDMEMMRAVMEGSVGAQVYHNVYHILRICLQNTQSRCPSRTSYAITIHCCTISTSSPASSAATAMSCVRKKRSISDGTTRTRSIHAKGSCTISSV